MVVQPNKAIVGANAFAHEAGIHQDGMLKNEETYEIMRPETVGASRTQLVLGKHSGRHAFGARLAELGYPLDGGGVFGSPGSSGEQLEKAFARFKALADKKKRITDADLVALVSDELYRAPEHLRLDGLQVACGSMGLPTATLRLRSGEGEAERLHVRACVGTGPVDAVFKAIDQVAAEIGLHPDGIELLEYTVTSVTEGIDALGEVSVRVRSKGEDDDQLNPQREDTQQRVYHGHGTDTDIIVASAKAYLSALNRLVAAKAASEKAA